MDAIITSLTIVYSIVYSDADQRKHQSSASLAFVQGIHTQLTGEFLAQMASNVENVSIWWCHHAERASHVHIWECHSFEMKLWKLQRTYTQLIDISIHHYNDVIMTTMASQFTSLTVVYLIAYSNADQRKHQSSASLAFVRGIQRSPVNSPHKGPVTWKMFPFDDVIM